MDLDPDELELWDDLVLVVQRSLAAYPADAARLAVNNTDFTMSVHPLQDGAASIQIDYCGTYEIYLEVGQTDAWIWQVDDTPLPEWLHRIVSGVMAGDFEEVGSFNASGRVRSVEGDISFGAVLLTPLPWRWRRRRKYLPYA